MAENPRPSKLEPANAETLLCQIAKECHARGWALGTSGNFSSVVCRQPLVLTITRTGLHKGTLSQDDFVRVDEKGAMVDGTGYPSAETALHLLLANVWRASAILHTHSSWSTVISDLHAHSGGLWIEGYEMLKGLEGVKSHFHREWLPIIENDQDMARLAKIVGAKLTECPNVHGFLLRRHGLYTWGEDLEQARRHLEILEFLLEVVGRTRTLSEAAADAH